MRQAILSVAISLLALYAVGVLANMLPAVTLATIPAAPVCHAHDGAPIHCHQ